MLGQHWTPSPTGPGEGSAQLGHTHQHSQHKSVGPAISRLHLFFQFHVIRYYIIHFIALHYPQHQQVTKTNISARVFICVISSFLLDYLNIKVEWKHVGYLVVFFLMLIWHMEILWCTTSHILKNILLLPGIVSIHFLSRRSHGLIAVWPLDRLCKLDILNTPTYSGWKAANAPWYLITWDLQHQDFICCAVLKILN